MTVAEAPSAREERDPLHLYALRFSPAGASFEELGYRVKQALLTTRLRLGRVAQILRDTHVGTAALTQAAPELLPLPVLQPSVEEANLRSAEAAGATPQHLRTDLSRSLKIAGCHCCPHDRRFYEDVDFARSHVVPEVPDVKWSDMLRSKRVRYNGDVLVKGMALTWKPVACSPTEAINHVEPEEIRAWPSSDSARDAILGPQGVGALLFK